MGLFDGEDKLSAARMLGALEAKVELLEKQNTELKERCIELEERVKMQMETIIAIQHPQSFRDLQDARAIDAPIDEATVEARKRFIEEQKILREFSYEQEQPLFKDADDMLNIMEKLQHSQGSPNTAGHSLHDNSES